MSNKIMVDTLNDNTTNLKDGTKTPSKMNAFHLLMNSRHNVIGSNSTGKDKKDVEMKSPELKEKFKEKLNKRKAAFGEWAEKKGGMKRKLNDDAAEKHINKTLHKRAKRLKKMLAIIDEELKNSGEEGSDSEEIFVKVKARKHRPQILIDSDNSSNADDINDTEKCLQNRNKNLVNEVGNKKQKKSEFNSPEVTEKENVKNNIDKKSKNINDKSEKEVETKSLECNKIKNVKNNNQIKEKQKSKAKTELNSSKNKEKKHVENSLEVTEEKIIKISDEEIEINSSKIDKKENVKNITEKKTEDKSLKEVKVKSSKDNKTRNAENNNHGKAKQKSRTKTESISSKCKEKKNVENKHKDTEEHTKNTPDEEINSSSIDEKENVKKSIKPEKEVEIKSSKDIKTENVENNKVKVKQALKAKTEINSSRKKDKKNVENKLDVTEEQTNKLSDKETEMNSSKIDEKEKVKQSNKTPTKVAEIISSKKNNEINSNKKKPRKKSLSVKKTKDVDEIPTVSQENKSNKCEENGPVYDVSDEEIFPTNKLEIKKSRLKLVNDSNLKKSEEKECFSPRAWRMRVKLIGNTDNKDVSEDKSEGKESDSEKSEDKKSESNYEENEEENDHNESENRVNDNPLKEVKNKEVISFSGSLSSSGCESKKQVKLAPIFLRQQQKKVDKNALNAKKDFLYSGVPSKVKKLMTKSKSFQEPEFKLNIFPKVSHIQQRAADDSLNTFWELPETSLPLSEKYSNINAKLLFDEINIGSFTNCKSVDININTKNFHAPNKYKNLKQIVKEIKQEYPSYPVYKTFRLLYQKYEKYVNKPETKVEETPKIETPIKPKKGRPKKKKEALPEKSTKIDPDSGITSSRLETLMWTEKYKPQSQEDIVGNLKEVQELKSWLESWISYSEDRKSSRKRRLSNSSDDFCSDSTKDSDVHPQNLILLFGPLGSGKTSSVYGLCNELSINVIEINASSKRPGKKILADLQEATQSHQVKNTDSKSVGGFFQKKPDSQTEDDNKKLSLLLFEDVDIVFEDQDDNFISALATLVISSKRPIILTATDKKCPYLQKFIMQYSVITFNSLTSKFLSPWLQILCLIEGVRADKDMIDKLVQWNKGDVRKTILQLQFWTQTGGDSQDKSEKLSECVKIIEDTKCLTEEEICVDDENPDILWLNSDESSTTQDVFCHENCTESFIPYYERDKQGFKLSYPVNLEVLWWNVPEILNQNNNFFRNNFNETKTVINSDIEESKMKETKTSLNSTIDFLESLVLADTIHTQLKTECYDEPIYNYWQTNPVNSLSLDQNFSMYHEKDILSLEITHWIVENSAKQCQSLRENKHSKFDANIGVPYFDELSWRSKRHKSMKELLSAVPIPSILDRRAICEDYLMILRSITRTENERSATNNKRKNRFYHYLKNLNIHLNDSTYLLLCNTLATNVK